MDDLVRIKSLESRLASDLEAARKDAASRVEAAKSSRDGIVDEAARGAQARAKELVDEAVKVAQAEAEEIRGKSDEDVRVLQDRYSKNSAAAVKCVLKGIGA